MDQVSSFELAVDGYFSMNFSKNVIHVEVGKYGLNINSGCMLTICICILVIHRPTLRAYVIYDIIIIIIITLFIVGAKHNYVTIKYNEANLGQLIKLLNRKE